MSSIEIKQILTKFIQHVNELEAKDERTTMTGFEQEFRELRMLGIRHKEEDTFPAEEGKKTHNIKKNRYKDIIPYDCTRVKLSPIPNVPGSDYINANYIESASKGHGYIASQGPLPNTVGDFWRMIMELHVDTVVMACKEEESNKPKCERYWPKDGESKTFGTVDVQLEMENKVSSDFIIRKLKAKHNDEVREITQLHLAEWPDHGVPDVEDQTSILDAITMLSERTRKDIPVVVHCSAGCGRTGTICSIDYAQTLLKDGNITADFSLFEIIKRMRTQRQSMVQTPDQYQLAHYVVRQIFRNHLKSLGHGAVYENVNIFENVNSSQNNISIEPEYADISEMGKQSNDDDESISSSSSLPHKPDTLQTSSPKSSNATTPIRSPSPKIKTPIKQPSPGHLPTSLSSSQPLTEHQKPHISKSESVHTYQNIEINSDASGKFVTRVRLEATECKDDVASQASSSSSSSSSQPIPAINLHRQSVPPAKNKKMTHEYENVQINGNQVPEITISKGATSGSLVHFAASQKEERSMSNKDNPETESLYTKVTKSHMRSFSEPENTVSEMSAMKSPASLDFGAQESDLPNLPPRKYKDEPEEKSKEEKHTGKFGKMLGMFHIKNSSSSDKHSGKHQKITETGFPHRTSQPKGPRDPPSFFKK